MSYEHIPEIPLTRQNNNTFVEESRKVRKRQTEDKENVQPDKVPRTGDYQSIKIQVAKHVEKGKENIDILERSKEKIAFKELSKIHSFLVVNVKDAHKSKVFFFFDFINGNL